MIRKAFVELMYEKGIDGMTVTDIVARADINRGTFYAHYRDARSVLAEIENEPMGRLDASIEECNEKDLVGNPLPILRKIGDELEKNIDTYRLLMSSSVSASFLETLRGRFIERMMNDPRTKARYRNRSRFRTTISFFAGGMIALYQDWFAGKMDKTLSEMAETVCMRNPYRKGG